MRQSAEQLATKKNPAKFTGDIILTPSPMEDFISMYFSATITDYPLISKTSILADKISTKIASENLNIYSMPLSDKLDNGYFLTADGYKTSNMPVIEKGVLKNFILSLYGAKKTGFKRSASAGGAYVIPAGNTSLQDIIKSVDKGIILGRFSGGDVSAGCDFSGVAKNSYLVEKGKIKYPLSETMISGNLADLFSSVKSISKERINDGSSLLGWLCSSGITVA
jgi:PmbA protein